MGSTTMKMARDKRTGDWVLTAGATVLYRGRRSPWDTPSILRDAIAREGFLRRTVTPA